MIDMDEAIREVHALGSTGFAGKQARKHKEAQYKALTGRDMKRQKVPLPIVRGIKKKRAERTRVEPASESFMDRVRAAVKVAMGADKPSEPMQ